MRFLKACVPFLGKSVKTCLLELVALIVMIALLACGLALWRLASGPVPLDFAQAHIEEAINSRTDNIQITLEKAVLEWPDVTKPVIFGLQDVRVTDRQGQDIVSAEQLGFSFSLRDLVKAELGVRAIYIKKPRLSLIRDENGIRLQQMENSNLPGGKDLNMPAIVKEWASGAIKDGPPGLSSLSLLEIEDASLAVNDEVMELSWFLPGTNITIARDENGAHAKINTQIPDAAQSSDINAALEYRLADSQFHFYFEGREIDPQFLGQKIERLAFMNDHKLSFDMDVHAVVSEELQLKELSLSLGSGRGFLRLPDFYEEDRSFDSFHAHATYDAEKQLASIRDMSLVIEGLEIKAVSSFTFDPDAEKLFVPINIMVEEAEADKVGALFPPKLSDTDAHEWLTEKISGGRYKDVAVDIDLNVAPESRAVELDNIVASFAFEDADITYKWGMHPVENAYGHGRFDYRTDTLEITGDSLLLNGLKSENTKVVLDALIEEGKGHADIKTTLSGPLGNAFAYIAREPIGYGKELGINPEEIKGEADLDVHVRFPALPDVPKEDVEVKVTGTLKDVVMPGLVEGLDLTGGPYDLEVADNEYVVKGEGMLSGRNIKLEWRQYFESEGKPWSGRALVEIGADRALREHFGVNLDDYVSGTLPVKIDYRMRLKGQRDTLDIEADLTPVLLTFAPLEYAKAAQAPASGSAQIILDDDRLIEVKSLNLEGQDLLLQNGRFIFGQVKGERDVVRAQIDRLKMNDNDFALEFEQENTGLLKMSLTGKTLDARPFLRGDGNTEDAQSEPPMIVSADILRMITGDNDFVRNAKLYVAIDKEGDPTQLEMDANAGDGDIYIRYKPDQKTGRKDLQMEASDAGAALKAFGVNDNVRGGRLVVVGEPTRSAGRGGDLAGQAVLSDFRVVEAPALARLLSAMSLPGLTQLLNNEGLVFAKLEADFDWLSRPQGAVLVLRNGRTSGNSLGLTFDGVVDRETGKIDLSGTIVPLSMFNKMVGGIPLIGDILAGGAGGSIFAATYAVRGPLGEPRITVNPLAVLAPGILRKILFEGG